MAQTHFGYQTVDEQPTRPPRARRVRLRGARYDLMNDLLSLGMHRAWKAYTVAVAA
jgi:demethylmenaquinone methyltransferase/2-methoxy-6-polyprenyl-1,4-benzoquinol methylase